MGSTNGQQQAAGECDGDRWFTSMKFSPDNARLRVKSTRFDAAIHLANLNKKASVIVSGADNSDDRKGVVSGFLEIYNDCWDYCHEVKPLIQKFEALLGNRNGKEA